MKTSMRVLAVLMVTLTLILSGIAAADGPRPVSGADGVDVGVTPPDPDDVLAYIGDVELADGAYEIQVTLYSQPEGGEPLGESLVFDGVAVEDGFFNLEIQLPVTYGPTWAEVRIRPKGSEGAFMTLENREFVKGDPGDIVPLAVGVCAHIAAACTLNSAPGDWKRRT